MAGKPNSKLKLLYLLDILWHYSDEDHVLTAKQLCEKLEDYGVQAERKSIYTDIATLSQFGLDIINAKSPRRGFFMASRQYEIAEVRLLIDAVQAANFISNKKTIALKDKLYRLVSRSQAEDMESQVFIENKLKCDNEEMYYIIDTINKAIRQGMQIEFSYKKRKLTRKMTTSNEEKKFLVNPYALVWINDRYYLICNNPKYDNLMHTRLDRMKKIEILDEKARSFAEVSEYKHVFDATDYASKMFNMYSGEVNQIELRCSNSIIDEILDRFGSEMPLKADGDEHFIIKVQAAMSEGLVSWLLQYGAAIKVQSPMTLANEVKENAARVLALYEDVENVLDYKSEESARICKESIF